MHMVLVPLEQLIVSWSMVWACLEHLVVSRMVCVCPYCLFVCLFVYSFLVYLATFSITEEDHEKAQVK